MSGLMVEKRTFKFTAHGKWEKHRIMELFLEVLLQQTFHPNFVKIIFFVFNYLD
jgi:hypothetical protein